MCLMFLPACPTAMQVTLTFISPKLGHAHPCFLCSIQVSAAFLVAYRAINQQNQENPPDLLVKISLVVATAPGCLQRAYIPAFSSPGVAAVGWIPFPLGCVGQVLQQGRGRNQQLQPPGCRPAYSAAPAVSQHKEDASSMPVTPQQLSYGNQCALRPPQQRLAVTLSWLPQWAI